MVILTETDLSAEAYKTYLMKTKEYRHRSGLTLVELLVVIAVIGILSSLLIPALKNVRLKAKVVKVHGELKSLSDGLEIYLNTFQKYPPARKGCTTNQGDYNAFPQEMLELRVQAPQESRRGQMNNHICAEPHRCSSLSIHALLMHFLLDR